MVHASLITMQYKREMKSCASVIFINSFALIEIYSFCIYLFFFDYDRSWILSIGKYYSTISVYSTLLEQYLFISELVVVLKRAHDLSISNRIFQTKIKVSFSKWLKYRRSTENNGFLSPWQEKDILLWIEEVVKYVQSPHSYPDTGLCA